LTYRSPEGLICKRCYMEINVDQGLRVHVSRVSAVNLLSYAQFCYAYKLLLLILNRRLYFSHFVSKRIANIPKVTCLL
jgi:hypothetical protein